MSHEQLAAVRDALHKLYFVPDPAAKKAANSWLEAYQLSAEAWGISRALLSDGASTPEHQLFSAHTLHTKLKRGDEKEQLSGADIDALQGELLFLVCKAVEQSATAHFAALATQLALALASLLLRTESHWDNANVPAIGPAPGGTSQGQSQGPAHFSITSTPLATLLESMEQQAADGSSVFSAEVKMLAALRIFTVLPEECLCPQVKLYSRWREQVVVLLCSAAGDILGVLEKGAATAGTQAVLLQAIFTCLDSWLTLVAAGVGCAIDAAEEAKERAALMALRQGGQNQGGKGEKGKKGKKGKQKKKGGGGGGEESKRGGAGGPFVTSKLNFHPDAADIILAAVGKLAQQLSDSPLLGLAFDLITMIGKPGGEGGGAAAVALDPAMLQAVTAATDAVTNVVTVFELDDPNATSPGVVGGAADGAANRGMMKLAERVLSHIQPLRSAYATAAEPAKAASAAGFVICLEDPRWAKGGAQGGGTSVAGCTHIAWCISRVLVQLTNAYTRVLLHQACGGGGDGGMLLLLLQAIADCTLHPCTEVSMGTFAAWEVLVEEMKKTAADTARHQSSVDSIHTLLAPCVDAAAAMLVERGRYPHGYERDCAGDVYSVGVSDWECEARDAFHHLRRALRDVLRMLLLGGCGASRACTTDPSGGAAALRFIHAQAGRLLQLAQVVAANPQQQQLQQQHTQQQLQQQITWQTAESILHCLSALARNLPPPPQAGAAGIDAAAASVLAEVVTKLPELAIGAAVATRGRVAGGGVAEGSEEEAMVGTAAVCCSTAVMLAVQGNWVSMHTVQQQQQLLAPALRLLCFCFGFSENAQVVPFRVSRDSTEHAGAIALLKLMQSCAPAAALALPYIRFNSSQYSTLGVHDCMSNGSTGEEGASATTGLAGLSAEFDRHGVFRISADVEPTDGLVAGAEGGSAGQWNAQEETMTEKSKGLALTGLCALLREYQQQVQLQQMGGHVDANTAAAAAHVGHTFSLITQPIQRIATAWMDPNPASDGTTQWGAVPAAGAPSAVGSMEEGVEGKRRLRLVSAAVSRLGVLLAESYPSWWLLPDSPAAAAALATAGANGGNGLGAGGQAMLAALAQSQPLQDGAANAVGSVMGWASVGAVLHEAGKRQLQLQRHVLLGKLRSQVAVHLAGGAAGQQATLQPGVQLGVLQVSLRSACGGEEDQNQLPWLQLASAACTVLTRAATSLLCPHAAEQGQQPQGHAMGALVSLGNTHGAMMAALMADVAQLFCTCAGAGSEERIWDATQQQIHQQVQQQAQQQVQQQMQQVQQQLPQQVQSWCHTKMTQTTLAAALLPPSDGFITAASACVRAFAPPLCASILYHSLSFRAQCQCSADGTGTGSVGAGAAMEAAKMVSAWLQIVRGSCQLLGLETTAGHDRAAQGNSSPGGGELVRRGGGWVRVDKSAESSALDEFDAVAQSLFTMVAETAVEMGGLLLLLSQEPSMQSLPQHQRPIGVNEWAMLMLRVTVAGLECKPQDVSTCKSVVSLAELLTDIVQDDATGSKGAQAVNGRICAVAGAAARGAASMLFAPSGAGAAATAPMEAGAAGAVSSSSRQQLRQALQQQLATATTEDEQGRRYDGVGLVRGLLGALACNPQTLSGGFPSDMCEPLCSTVQRVHEVVGLQAFGGWLHGAVAKEGFPAACATNVVKEQFVTMFLATEPGSKPFRAILKKFCREGKVGNAFLYCISDFELKLTPTTHRLRQPRMSVQRSLGREQKQRWLKKCTTWDTQQGRSAHDVL
jgi:hypothetical protein